MAVTLLEKMINPQVLGQMVSYELEKKLRISGFYKVDTTLSGRAGDTITIPSWKYIGAAVDVAENEQVPSREMDTQDISYTIKKAAIEVTLTDEAVLSGYGDPVGETGKQLRLAIQDKMDMDGVELLRGITPENGLYHDAGTEVMSYNLIVGGLDFMNLEEQGTNLYVMMNSKNLTALRKDERFYARTTASGDAVFNSGTIGTIAGCQVVISNHLANTEAYILTPNSLTAFMKRNVNLETGREMSFKRTKIGTDVHYTIAIEDYNKIVAMHFSAGTATTRASK